MRPIAGNAALRIFQKTSRWTASRATSTPVASACSHRPRTSSNSASHSCSGPSSSTSSAAPASGGQPAWAICSEASIVSRSIISMAPIEQTTWLEGSGGKKCEGPTALEIARFVTPGSQTTRWLARSMSRMRRRRLRTIRTPSCTGRAPPERPLPEPRATHGTPAAWQARTTAATSSAVPGSTAARGTAAYWSRPSDSYVRSWWWSVRTWRGPTMVRSRSARSMAHMMNCRRVRLDADRFADLIAGYCLEVRPRQQVLVRSTTLAAPLLIELQRAILERDAWPLLRIELPGQAEGFYAHARDGQLDAFPGLALREAKDCDATVGIQAPENTRALAGVDPARIARLARGRREVR